MKKTVLLILNCGLLLLTGCNQEKIEDKATDFSKNKFDNSNKNDVYKILNDCYNDSFLNYESFTTGSISSESKTLNINFASTFLKNQKKYYRESTFSSTYFGDYSFQRYEDYSTNTFGYSTSNDLSTSNDTLKGINFPTFTYLEKKEYLNKYVNHITSILPYEVYEGYENLSFKNVSVENSTSYNTIKIDVNTESVKKNNQSNTIDSFTAIDGNNYFTNLYLSYFSSNLGDTSTHKFISSTFTININNNSNQIENIKIEHSFKLSQTIFNASYITTFKVIDNSNNYSSITSTLKNEIDNNINYSNKIVLLELYGLFKSLDDYYKTTNYYSVTTGTASALGGIYNQSIKGYKLKYNQDYFFTNVTTSAFVKKAETRFHNIEKNKYKIGTGDNPSDNGKYGSVSKWNEMTDYSKEDFISIIGHTLDGISNYTLDQDLSKTFKNATIKKDGEYYVYTYSISFKEDDKHIDACKEYKNEMNHMSNMGIPEFSKCEFQLYLNSSKDKIIKTVANEEYKTGGFQISSSLENFYYEYKSINEVPNDITSAYKNLIKE